MIWTSQQSHALDAVGKWLANPASPQTFRLFGYAGTGKTTLARHLASLQRGTVLFAAFTGKAASVLRDAGCDNATTLHSLLYTPGSQDPTAMMEAKAHLESLDAQHPYYPEARDAYESAKRKYHRPRFTLNPDSVLKDAALLVLDEVSMVNAALARDILSFGKRVLVLGDPGQLPPIEGAGYFTNRKPDVMLTDITRQAKDSPILRWATMAREGISIPPGVDGDAVKMSKKTITDAWLTEHAGQLLTGKNQSRVSLNDRVRKHLGLTSVYPAHNDVLVCLRNNHQVGVLNGVICNAFGPARVVSPGVLSMGVRYEGRLLDGVPVDDFAFTMAGRTSQREIQPMPGLLQFDYGYAITVHKSQGSQWPTVTIWDDGFGKWEEPLRRQWLYTAITRAKTKLTILSGTK